MSASDCPVDVDTLDMLRDLADEDNPDFFEELMKSYMDDAKILADNLHEGASSADLDLMARSAHTLKSSSANIGANDLAALCGEIERRTRVETNIPDAQERAGEVTASLSKVLEFITTLV